VAEITEQEAREAVGRICQAISDEVKGIIDADTAERLYGTRDLDVALELGRDDLKKAVEFARQELARRDAERVEREKPIDAEWCLANGAYHEGDYGGEPGWFSSDIGSGELLSVEESTGDVYIFREHDGTMTRLNGKFKTRGTYGDLLAAMKGGAT